MDYYAKIEERKAKHFSNVGGLSYERYQLATRVESNQRRITEIDRVIAGEERVIAECETAQKEFDSYLAIEKGALTMGDIQKGVADAAQPES